MIHALRSPIHRSGILLLLATGLTFWLGESGAAGPAIVASILLLACLKGRLIVLHFMELRDAPLLWRALLEGWLLVVSGAILLAYWLSLSST